MWMTNCCGQCGKEYDNVEHKPIKLECTHIICCFCALQLYQGNFQILCPWDQQVTKKNPALLPVEVFKLQFFQKFTDCPKHSAPNTLYCKDEKMTICHSCASFTKQHKGHNIVDIEEEIESLKKNEMKVAQENYNKIIGYIDKLQMEKNEQTRNVNLQVKQIIQQLEQYENEIINHIKQLKQVAMQSLLQEQNEFQQQLEKKMIEVNQLSILMDKIQIQDQDNFSELLDFIEKVENLNSKVNDKQLKRIELYQIPQETQMLNVKKMLNSIFQFQIKHSEITFSASQDRQQKQRYGDLKGIITVQQNTKKKKEYIFQENKFKQEFIKTSETEDNFSQIEQIGEQSFIISGGNIKKKRFSIINNGNEKESSMCFGRHYHRTVFDHSSKVYIISGTWDQIKQCEVYDFESQQFKQISDISEATGLCGAFIDEAQNIYITGGYTSGPCTNKIQIYDCQINQ